MSNMTGLLRARECTCVKSMLVDSFVTLCCAGTPAADQHPQPAKELQEPAGD